MTKTGTLLLIGLAVALAGFACAHLAGTASARALMRQPEPELAWLKKEFSLSDDEFKRVQDLHRAYLPKCAERCKAIAAQNALIESITSSANALTPNLQLAIKERADIRALCETEMIAHFIAVSRTMNSEQGKRYLAWVRQQSAFTSEGMESQHHFGPDPARTHSHGATRH